MVFRTKTDLYKYLKKFNYASKKSTELSSVYFLTKYGDIIEPLYFTNFENVWFPSPCELRSVPMTDDQLVEYVKAIYEEDSFGEALKFEKIFQKDGIHYEINNPQCYPFLPKSVEILDAFSEEECLEWLLKNRKED